MGLDDQGPKKAREILATIREGIPKDSGEQRPGAPVAPGPRRVDLRRAPAKLPRKFRIPRHRS